MTDEPPLSLAFLPRRQPSATDPNLFAGRFSSDPPTGLAPEVAAVTANDPAPTTEEEYRHQIGRRVRLARISLNLTQEEVAARAGVTRNYVSATERAAQHLDTWRLFRLGRALHLEIAWLLGIE